MKTYTFTVTCNDFYTRGYDGIQAESKIKPADLKYGLKQAMHCWSNEDREQIEVEMIKNGT